MGQEEQEPEQEGQYEKEKMLVVTKTITKTMIWYSFLLKSNLSK